MSDADVTRLLLSFSAGDAGAAERVLPVVYDELCRIAGARLRTEHDAATLAPSDLVHEAFLRLVRVQDVTWQNRAHFFALASQTMRRVLVDRARQRFAGKRGGGARAVTLDDRFGSAVTVSAADDLLALDAALDALAQRAPRQARVVECRYFAGLSFEETAEVLGVSLRTAKEDWRLARAWLYLAMQ